MSGSEHLDDAGSLQPSARDSVDSDSSDASSNYVRIIPRLRRNIVILSCLLIVPAFWYYRIPGCLGFACGAAVSYVNFRLLARGVESLADRVINRSSREKGGRIIFRFLVRYGLVAAVAYAIFKGSPLAFYGFLWGLCVPAASLMVEAIIEGFTAFRRSR